ncbi:hypothetical protein CFOL_v3_27747 [Cephalotus follicularis]|uniref:WRKY domain-containing protein n=1 Tax=Cephalotus follicularis TaxID=3775 RepID=A0A1Q3CW70_CEPFO|nr:hypothetical protein CFOL_v3_27747 [Cephalotus follicularis]
MTESKLKDSVQTPLPNCDCSSFTQLLKEVLMTTNATQLGFQKLSPAIQSKLSVPHSAPTTQEPMLALQNSAPPWLDVNQHNCNHGTTNYTDVVMFGRASEGYGWRKYGQK